MTVKSILNAFSVVFHQGSKLGLKSRQNTMLGSNLMLKPPQPIMNGVHGKSIASMTGLPNGKAKVAPMDNPDIQIEVGVYVWHCE